ncbi:hypothetical protein [Pectobacterium fontis]|uniref:Uncharacterized protein n=1 Tax=Pectobacterium fontis TaxID=2558042 RepID=A0A7V8L3P9_9GAMM|nr:hypothetical protein [Pectobacterium fontis]KHN49262.1 hypothetical protein OI69_18460 [Pectobacterium fontis]
MVKNERIIKFPLPDWNEPFVLNDDLDAYCICYQYDFDQNGFGPYGFNTDNGKKIINAVFDDNLYYLNKSNMEKVTKSQLVKKKGVYVYSKQKPIGDLYCIFESYKKSCLKNEIKKRKSLPLSPEPIKPVVFKLMEGGQIYSKDIKEILDMGYGVFIINHYMPEAGDAFIFFDNDLYFLFKKCAMSLNVGCLVVDSINKLNSW